MGHHSPFEDAADVGPFGQHCNKPTPEEIAWDASLTVDEREQRLQKLRRGLGLHLCGPDNARILVEMERVFEALHVVSAMRRSAEEETRLVGLSVFR